MVTKYVETIMVGAALLALLVTGVSAAQSQGLHWGYEEGQQYYFIERDWNIDQTELPAMNFMLMRSDYPSIPDPLTNSSYLPWTAFQVYFTDGRLATSQQPIWGPGAAVPIGNWSLLSKVFENHYTNTSIWGNATSFRLVEDSETWGFIFVRTNNALPDTNSTTHVSYSKQDGVLVSNLQQVYELGNETLTTSFIRLPMSPELQTTLTIGGVLGVVAIAIVIYVRLRRR